jgi:hypothetical protein
MTPFDNALQCLAEARLQQMTLVCAAMSRSQQKRLTLLSAAVLPGKAGSKVWTASVW